MWETGIAFLGGVFFSPICFWILFLICLLWEHNEHPAGTMIFEIILLVVAWKLFSLNWTYVGYGALAYIPIGFAWSFWRWFRHCRNVIAEAEQKKKDAKGSARDFDGYDVRNYKSKIDVREQYDKIIFWILNWPISFVEMLFGDIYDGLKIMVKKVCRKMYEAISSRYNNKLDSMLEK